jgi:hypothetical protein
MNDLWVPYRRHAATFVLGALPLLAVAAVGLAAGSEPWVWGALAIAITPLLIAGILWLVCLMWDRRLRALAAEEEPLLRWTYSTGQWSRHVESLDRKARLIGPVLAGILLAVGVLVALLLVFDEDRAGEPSPLLWALPVGGSLAGGLYVWALVAWNVASTRRARLRRGGVLILGGHGFYLTGEYRPIAGLGQSLTGVRYEEEGEPRLVLTWHVTSGRTSSDHEVVVPVPPGHEDEAREAVRILTAVNKGDVSLC